MKRAMWSAMVLGSLLWAGVAKAQTSQAQTQQSEFVVNGDTDQWHGRAFLLVTSTDAQSEQATWQNYYYGGGWNHAERLRAYARAHPGSYVVFEEDGQLFRLDSPAAVAEANKLREPIDHLAAIQEQLAKTQKPLAEQQRALGAQMRATHDPATMGRIGREQGTVGRQQGVIGREQGSIGRQQGTLGRAFYQNVQQSIDRCLADKSCNAAG